MVAGEENTYFLRAFEALGVTEDRRTADPDTQATAGFKAIMRDAADAHPTTVSKFATEADAAAWIAEHQRRVQAESQSGGRFGKSVGAHR
ncbi:MAG: hypothetical protein WA633_13675 [Stellaceae bacterium]